MSLSPSMDGSVIFVNSSLNLHAVSQLPLAVSPLPQTVVVQLSFSCLSSFSQNSPSTLFWSGKKYRGITFNHLTSRHWSLRL